MLLPFNLNILRDPGPTILLQEGGGGGFFYEIVSSKIINFVIIYFRELEQYMCVKQHPPPLPDGNAQFGGPLYHQLD